MHREEAANPGTSILIKLMVEETLRGGPAGRDRSVDKSSFVAREVAPEDWVEMQAFIRKLPTSVLAWREAASSVS